MSTRIATDEELAAALRLQADNCRILGSPFTGRVLDILRDDLVRGGITRRLVGDWRLPPMDSALALRLTGALHALVCRGDAPELARWYPPEPEFDADSPEFADRISATLSEHFEFAGAFLTRAVQTNEVQRSAVLIPGFREIAARTALPLRILEIGASGGLNLLWDRYGMDLPGASWGPEDAVLRFRPEWTGPLPQTPGSLSILDRRGVDLQPLDFRSDAAVANGLAYLWPDQAWRMRNFRAAVAALRRSEVLVETGSAADWLPEVLAPPRPDSCTVVFHSIMWQYMPDPVQDAVAAAILEAGARSRPTSPLAWLRFEPRTGALLCELTLQLWTGDAATAAPVRERLCWAHPHGSTVRWLDPPEPCD